MGRRVFFLESHAVAPGLERLLHAFALSLGIVFLAELGDKTQLVALCLASRFNAWVTLAGVFVATLLVHVFSVLIGRLIGGSLPQEWVNLVAGLAFVGFGLWTLRGDSLDDESCGNRRFRSPFMVVTVTFFLAELGDKTMLSTVALATKYDLWMVWIGSTLGMVISDGLAIIVGQVLGKNLPERVVHVGAAVIFFLFGAYSGVSGAVRLPAYAWAAALAVVAVMLILFHRARPASVRCPVGSTD